MFLVVEIGFVSFIVSQQSDSREKGGGKDKAKESYTRGSPLYQVSVNMMGITRVWSQMK